MLETVKVTISERHQLPFNEYFNRYVAEVQDQAIDNEIEFIVRNNFLDINMLMRLIDNAGGQL